MDGDSIEIGVMGMGCPLTRRLQLMRELRGMWLATLSGGLSVKTSRLPMPNKSGSATR